VTRFHKTLKRELLDGKVFASIEAIRAWAWENGIDLSNRRRIPANVVEKRRASLPNEKRPAS